MLALKWLIYVNHSSQSLSENWFFHVLKTYPSGSNNQQRVIQKSFVTSALVIHQWNFSLLIFIPIHPMSVVMSLFVIFVFDTNQILTGVIQKLGSVNV
jgi:hypothetical protein